MKFMNKIFFAICMLSLCGACSKDFLNRPPLSQITGDNFYKTSDQIRLGTASMYAGSMWFKWNSYPMIGLGDIMAGNLLAPYGGNSAIQVATFTTNSSNTILADAWSGLYDVVAQANVNISALKNVPDSVPSANVNAAIGELRFFRASAYFYLVQLWGAVPIIEDNYKLIANPLVPRHKREDVYKFIINDLTFAAQNLPPADAKGRVTLWSAEGMLAKVYLTRAGLNQTITRTQSDLDSAAYFAGDVCNNSGLSLLPSYYNLFRSQYNDNQESLFALQWVPGVGYGAGNYFQSNFAPSGAIITGTGGYGAAIGPTVDLYNQYSKTDSVRRKATFMLKGDYYPELNAAGGGYVATANACVKKHIIGTAADNNAPTMDGLSSIEHNTILRLADVYLVLAEAILGNNASTTDPTALQYFNLVRTRAGLNPLAVLTSDSLMKERRVELAFEGQYWFDLVRLSYYNPQAAINSLNAQNRVQFTYNNGVVTPNKPDPRFTKANVGTFVMQIPTNEVNQDSKLLDPPVSYY
ncbi:RagB/SusD family nutrient uptake outer membrane protein [Parasediminibacterium sp. JCM 36343]|uniref:RagB/SusD family nutrient uptake outer membrane protein n=1 Tax=Parasediminibacterium sp. JCM 36343 TaxID=3374279 RepID=UPI00397B7FD2